MEVIHITNNSKGYEIVTLLANRYNKKNHLLVLEKDGKMFMSGGIILNNHIDIQNTLDSMPPEEQYNFACLWKETPFVKNYYEVEPEPLEPEPPENKELFFNNSNVEYLFIFMLLYICVDIVINFIKLFH